ncbi:hypothetical protein Zm00014a_020373 [Zea mays]|uniref:Uncharacterized protein n=1 Tax=Zea mays TaxID=4577 RepID=A0A3L6FIF8_MAIZE|nr:hypothetical protein Zm00014a_020373 [Zea mays]
MGSKKMYVCSLPLMPHVVFGFVSSLLASAPNWQSYKVDDPNAPRMILLVIFYANVILLAEIKNVRIYIETATAVVISYVSLLKISWSYIWLVLFPIVGIGFIVALCKELSHEDEAGGSQEQEQSNEGKGEGEATTSSWEKVEGLAAVAMLPYWALLIMDLFHPDKFAVSQFLLFLSFMLGALTMMMTRLVETGRAIAHRGIVPASELLWKASLVVLLVAVHAVAAELLGENALLLCMPEILPVLLWLSVRLDTADDRIKLVLDSNLLPAAPPVVLAMLATGEPLLYWYRKALLSCVVSALLTFYVYFMLCQWPGGQRDRTLTGSSLQHAVIHLKSWAKVLLKAVAVLLIFVCILSN